MTFAYPEEAVVAIRRAIADRGDCAGLAVSSEAVETFPDDGTVWAWHSSCLNDRGRVEDAEAALEKAKSLAPGSAAVAGAAIKWLSFEGRFDEASEHVDRALAGNKLDVLGGSQAADLFLMTGVPEAIPLHERLVHENEDDSVAWGGYVVALTGADQAIPAVTAFEEMQRRFPENGRTLRLQARFALMRRDMQAALALREESAKASPESDLSWAELAQSYKWFGRTEEAKGAAERSLELNVRSLTACGVMAGLAEQAGRAEEAAEWRRKESEAVPGLKQMVPLAQAIAFGRKQQWKEAAEVLIPVLDAPLASTRRTAARMCAGYWRQARAWKRLAPVIDVLEKLGDRSPDYFLACGALQQGRKRTGAAVEWFAAGLELWPCDGSLRAQHLTALHSIGRAAEARQAAQEALGHLPSTPPGCMELLMALDHTKHAEQYLALLAKAKDAYPGRQEWTMCDALLAME